MEKENKKFIWTDELCREFITGYYGNTISSMEAFIKSKAKEKEKPLFITDDGVGIYLKSEYYEVLSDWSVRRWRADYGTTLGIRAILSTEWAAKEYVLMNKPKETPKCFYVVNNNWSIYRMFFGMDTPYSSRAYFTTEKEAEEYVLMNQPRYSIAEIDRLKEKWLYGDNSTDFKSFLKKEAK